jgi:hypothetical protein
MIQCLKPSQALTSQERTAGSSHSRFGGGMLLSGGGISVSEITVVEAGESDSGNLFAGCSEDGSFRW